MEQLVRSLLVCSVVADCSLILYRAYALNGCGPYDGHSLTLDKPRYFPQRSFSFDEEAVIKYQALMNSPGVKYSVTSMVVGYDPPIPVSPLSRNANGGVSGESLRIDVISEGVNRLIVGRGGKPEQYPDFSFLPANDPSLMHVLGADWPKLRIVRACTVAQTPGEIASLIADTPRLDQVVVLSGTAMDDISPPAQTDPTVKDAEVNIVVKDFDYNHIDLKADIGSNAPAWLVYADAYDPHWIATVNGQPAKVAVAYGAFKAVLLREAHNTVTMAYHDWPTELALNVLLVASVIFAGFMLGALGFQLGPRGRFLEKARASIANGANSVAQSAE